MQHHILKAIFLALSLSIVAQAAPAPHFGKPVKAPGHAKGPRAIYFISNDASNSVVALPVGQDGMLSTGTLTPTGGSGSAGIDSATNESAGPDALFSQAALTIAGNVSRASFRPPSARDTGF